MEDCGFIRKYIPVGYKERNATYQLIDNYTLFYLRFLNNRTYDVDAAFVKDMKRKISDFLIDSKSKYAIHPTLITTYGIVENAYSGELQSVITGEELF